MSGVRKTRNLFLRFMCAIYLFAFLSFYLQIPGLYGNNGILPVKSILNDEKSKDKSFLENFKIKPTLVWLAPKLGLNADYMLDLIALSGAVLSFCGFVSKSCCVFPLFLTLWLLYHSLYQVGQTFMLFQWDVLLLEAGFICMLCAPFKRHPIDDRFSGTPTDEITFFLVKWLLFRLVFASGVAKLASGCQSWWSLNALGLHFQSQPLPTPVAWYAHHLPDWFQRVVTVYTLVTEQLMPFLYFFPMRAVRVTGFFFQLILQAGMIITGNYNFFNLLIIILSITLLDDKIFSTRRRDPEDQWTKFLSAFGNIAVHGFVLYVTVINYTLRITPDWTMTSAIAFTKVEFDKFVKRAIPASIYIAGMTLFISAIYALWKCFKMRRNKLPRLLVTVFYVGAVYFVFGMSLVPHAALHPSSNSTIFPAFWKLHSKIQQFHITNSYGLFRKMPHVDGRLEVVIEGANDVDGPWIPYHFKYKPTNVNGSLSFVTPHQPRLDWQMWFAALGTYHQNPWLMSLVYRLLSAEKEVLRLMDNNDIFSREPPKYIRASLYEYRFSPWNERFGNTWWHREKLGEYFPIFARNHSPLKSYLEKLKILDSEGYEKFDVPYVANWLHDVLDYIREISYKVDPTVLIWSVYLAACLIIISIAYSEEPSLRRNIRF